MSGIQTWKTAGGATVLLAEDRSLPLVDFAVVLRRGAAGDPPELAGCTRMMARLVRRGRKGQKPAEVDEQIASFGARLAISLSRQSVRFHSTVLERNAEAWVSFLARMLKAPAFRKADLDKAKRRIKADLLSLQDDDYALASRHLRRHLFNGHAYGTPAGGTGESVSRIQRKDVVARWEEIYREGNLIFAFAGAIDRPTVERYLATAFGDLPQGTCTKESLKAPRLRAGRHLVIVDKKGRTQTQLGMATLGTKAKDPHRMALSVADTAFGGMFTSPLAQAVRAERGWSYSAQSHLGWASQRESWSMWTHPAVENLRGCAELKLGLLEQWVAQPDSASLERARRYLMGSHALDTDTAARRLELHLEAMLYGLKPKPPAAFVEEVGAVTDDAVLAALTARLDANRMTFVAVGEATRLEKELGDLPGLKSVEVVSAAAPL